jgi:hypothetical protein
MVDGRVRRLHVGSNTARDLNLHGNIRILVRSRTRGGFWRAIKAPLAQLRRPPIRKQGFRNSGFSDVADPRYHAPRLFTRIYDFLRFPALDGCAPRRSCGKTRHFANNGGIELQHEGRGRLADEHEQRLLCQERPRFVLAHVRDRLCDGGRKFARRFQGR